MTCSRRPTPNRGKHKAWGWVARLGFFRFVGRFVRRGLLRGQRLLLATNNCPQDQSKDRTHCGRAFQIKHHRISALNCLNYNAEFSLGGGMLRESESRECELKYA